MGYLRDFLLYLEPAILPELATYETEIFAGTVLVSMLTFACESTYLRIPHVPLHQFFFGFTFNSVFLVMLYGKGQRSECVSTWAQ